MFASLSRDWKDMPDLCVCDGRRGDSSVSGSGTLLQAAFHNTCTAALTSAVHYACFKWC